VRVTGADRRRLVLGVVAGVVLVALGALLFLVIGGDGGSTGDERAGGDDPASTQPAGGLPDGASWVATARGPTVNVYMEAGADEPIHQLPNPNENGAPLTFLVDGSDVSGELIPVLLPVPPNGSKGWVRARDVELASNTYRIRIELGAHRLTVTNGDEVVVDTEVGVGQSGRETPTGLYYVKELIQPPEPDGLYGPYAYGISGFTNNPEVAEEFGNGGVVGIHGTNDPSSIGQNVSSGCIRMPNDVITEMVEYLPLGTPVEIVP
jgi:lipoprotein-anchoring transpeptidase ErfK/SrfK